MKLEKIKLSGFKSFVDPTVIPVHGNLTAIVGAMVAVNPILSMPSAGLWEKVPPNICGAAIWLMSFLMAHPPGNPSVPHRWSWCLIIAKARSAANTPNITRSPSNVKQAGMGQSIYLLNGACCRRKDITDIFLGTGLGSRSYAIIEQGTISRMVEAKPEDLRIHIEEAAGISKYKERRSETETRMKHTRENLGRSGRPA